MQLQDETGPRPRMDLSLALPSSATPDGVGELALAATLFMPDEVADDDVRVLVCWPGGSYGRDYWDIRLPGHDGYSFAEHMTSRGFLVVAVDPLGVGDSGRPCHNFQPGRVDLWDRIGGWATGVAGPRPSLASS